MRNMVALIGNGVMDRYPRLRVGTLKAGHGWLRSAIITTAFIAGSSMMVLAQTGGAGAGTAGTPGMSWRYNGYGAYGTGTTGTAGW